MYWLDCLNKTMKRPLPRSTTFITRDKKAWDISLWTVYLFYIAIVQLPQVHALSIREEFLVTEDMFRAKSCIGASAFGFSQRPPSQAPQRSRHGSRMQEDTEGLDTCKFYNTSNGCDNNECQYLHLCRHYLVQNCKFGRNCKRNHNLKDPQVMEILQRRNIRRSPNQLKVLFMELFSPSTMAPPARAFSTMNLQSQGRDYDDSDDSDDTDDDESHSLTICPFNLIGKCKFGAKCRNIHKKMPYQWQFRKKRSTYDWTDVDASDNATLEEYFCDVDKNCCPVRVKNNEWLQVYFTLEDDGIFDSSHEVYFRRVSTPSWSETKPFPFATEWKWYWKTDENTWQEYGKSYKVITGDELEQLYSEHRGEIIPIRSKSTGFEYEINFKRKVQKNVSSRKTREIRRRPVFVSSDEFEKRRKSGGQIVSPVRYCQVPELWKMPRNDDVHGHNSRVKIFDSTNRSPDISSECQEVFKSFHESMPKGQATIHVIERVQNGDLWLKYHSEKESLARKKGNPNEMNLFHGTTHENVDAICKQGFDFRMNGTSTGTKYGKGSYFARKASLSNRYASSTLMRLMFRAKVLVGEYTLGNTHYKRPPQKSDLELYDSCVDNLVDPQIFVLFAIHQTYPEYIIHYTSPRIQ